LISRALFSKLKAQRFLLEYDDTRSGSFEPLRDVPDDKFVVLGLVTTKRPELEPIDLLRRRIIEATRSVPLQRIGVSPQCGFASSIIGNHISAEDQLRKLQLVIRTAETVWG
jgi:5-methyltetrahydropteroyltriglutamate--homocysteine methyltransferase